MMFAANNSATAAGNRNINLPYAFANLMVLNGIDNDEMGIGRNICEVILYFKNILLA